MLRSQTIRKPIGRTQNQPSCGQSLRVQVLRLLLQLGKPRLHMGEIALMAPTRLAALIVVLAIATILNINWRAQNGLSILALMGVLDTIALGSVISAGGMKSPEFAAVAASTFGLITVVLAAIFLREKMTKRQMTAVAAVFGAIAYLGL